MIKRHGASVSPCSTPAPMSKYSVSPSGERTFTLVYLWRIVIAATVSFGRPAARHDDNDDDDDDDDFFHPVFRLQWLPVIKLLDEYKVF